MRKLYILLAILLLAGMTASAQMKRGGQKKEVPKTEKTTSKKQKKQSGNSEKSTRPSEPGNATNSDAEQKRKQEEAAKQRAEEQRRQQEETERQRIIQQVVNDMVWVEGGTFKMGTNGADAFDDEKPVHKVTLSGFYISKYEVTQELWQAVMGNNPSHFTGNPRCPVEQVSWNDCQKFLEQLNKLTGRNFRLPTEAEWEFAARGGNQSRGYMYSGSNDPENVGWGYHNSGLTSHPVGMKSSNELGIYDMCGNVEEWCQDRYGKDYYRNSPSTNPMGPSSGYERVCRGGSCFTNLFSDSYVSCRSKAGSNDTFKSVGLRLAL